MTRQIAVFLMTWLVLLALALLLSIFLHEVGHGLGARLDGIHISTGFNKIGNPGRAPGDPDFRTGLTGGVWTGLLGPMTSWLLAAVFTVWLCRFGKATTASIVIGALAVANSLARAIPLGVVLLGAVRGMVITEDEVHWATWYIGRVIRPDLGVGGVEALIQSDPGLMLSFLALWIAVLVSFGISVLFFLLATRTLLHLWRDQLTPWSARALFLLAPFAVWPVLPPVLNALDRAIRINW